MDGTPYSPQDLVEVWRRKPRTLVLCFDGTSNEFCKRVRHAIFPTTLFNSFDVIRDLLEYECCQTLFYPEEGRPRVPNMLLSGAFFNYTQRTSQTRVRIGGHRDVLSTWCRLDALPRLCSIT